MIKIKFFILVILSFFLLSSCGELKDNTSLNNSKKIIALGDSLTIGYGLEKNDSYPSQLEIKLKEYGYKYSIINGGISGNTSKQLLKRLNAFDNIKADIYLLNIGANDGLKKMNLDNMQKNIENIVEHLQKKNPEGKIILFGTKLPILFGIGYSRDFNSRFEKIAKDKGVFYYGYFLDGVNGNSKLNLNDGMHPNKDGYDIISDNILEYLINNNFLTK